VAGCCECGDEHLGSVPHGIVSQFSSFVILFFTDQICHL
jgi:hypothetical protein